MTSLRPGRPPYYAVLQHRPAPGVDVMLHLDAVERLVGLAASEPSFLGVEDVEDEWGESFTICYWREAAALRRWLRDAPDRLPMEIAMESAVGATGCLWPWLRDVQEAQVRRPPTFPMPAEEPLDPAAAPTARPLRRTA
jgi:hypothetical protein